MRSKFEGFFKRTKIETNFVPGFVQNLYDFSLRALVSGRVVHFELQNKVLSHLTAGPFIHLDSP